MDQEEKYFKICEELEKIIKETGEPLEGNCVYRHHTLDPWDCLLNKRVNYQRIVRGKKEICEIGFNAGHSLLTMLLVNQDAKYTLFDLGKHAYSKPCLDYIKNIFSNVKIEMTWGDSRITLPKYHSKNPKIKFDVIHIDGGHLYEVYSKDWANSLQMISNKGIIIFDDTYNVKINTFVNKEIEKGIVCEADNFLETFGYKHRILIKR